MLRWVFFLLMICSCVCTSLAQGKKLILTISPSIYPYQRDFNDSLSRDKMIVDYLRQCKANGFVNARIARQISSGDSLLVFLEYGKQWYWNNLKYDSTLLQIFSNIRRSDIRVDQGQVNAVSLEEKIQLVLSYCENHGYPFAELYFDSVQFDSNRVSARLRLQLNDRIVFDSIRVQEPIPVNKKFLSAYLGIRAGEPYSERQLQAINTRISELPFLRLKQNPVVQFNNNQAQLFLKLDRRNANRFDGLLGFQPNGTSGQTQLIGQVQLSLVNAIKRAEKFDFEFRAQPNQTRDLRITLNYPYFLNLPFGLNADLVFRRQDSTFSIFNRELGISYLASAFNAVKIIYRLEESNLLSTESFEGATSLPNILDVRKNVYGLSWTVDAFNYRPNPTRGYRFALGAEAAFRNIEKNSVFTDSLYDGLALVSNQYILKGNLALAFPIFRKQVLFVASHFSALLAQQLFQNELFRIGGINSLRGFNEESIFSSSYYIQNFEYRYILDQNSFLRVFYDVGFSENKVISQKLWLQGIGAGMQIETAIGILQLNYAVGAQNQGGFDLRASKVHFGLINYF